MTIQKNKKIIIFFFILTVLSAGIFFVFKSAWPSVQKDPRFWSQVLRFSPQNPDALFHLANIMRQEPDFVEALESFRKVAQLKSEGLDPVLPEDVFAHLQKIQTVVQNYKKVIEIKEDYWPAYLELATVYEETGQLTEAFSVYIQLVKLNPKIKEPHIRLGYLYGMVGDAKSAMTALSHVLYHFPDEESSYLNVISVYGALIAQDKNNAVFLAQRVEAINAYAEFVNKSKPQSSHFFNLGVVYQEKGDWGRALSAYQTALDLSPRHSRACYNIGNIYRAEGRVNEALLMYKKAVAFDPQFSDGYLNIGGIFVGRKDWEEAKRYFEKAVRADALNAKAHFSLGLVHEQLGRLSEAVQSYEKAIKAQPRNPEFYFYLGHAYDTLKNSKEAEKAYLKVVSLSSNHVKAWVGLSKLAFEAKDYKKALLYIEEAQIAGYDVPQAYWNSLKALQGSL